MEKMAHHLILVREITQYDGGFIYRCFRAIFMRMLALLLHFSEPFSGHQVTLYGFSDAI
jgi:hypothetical protein